MLKSSKLDLEEIATLLPQLFNTLAEIFQKSLVIIDI